MQQQPWNMHQQQPQQQYSQYSDPYHQQQPYQQYPQGQPAFGTQYGQPPAPPAHQSHGAGQAWQANAPYGQANSQPQIPAYPSYQPHQQQNTQFPGGAAVPPPLPATVGNPINIQPPYAAGAGCQPGPPASAGYPPVYLGATLAADPLQPYAAIPLALPGYDPSSDVEAIRKATKGFGTDENALNRIFCLRTAAQIQVLTEAYKSRYGKNVIDILRKETSGYYEKTLCTIALGPLEGDVQLLHDAIAGAGTKESMVTEILVGRHPHELVLLRHAFAKRYNNKSLDKEVLDDLSFKTKDAFAIVLQGRWLDNGQVQPQLIERDLHELLSSFRLGFTNEMLICSIIFARSPTYLQALIPAFKHRNGKSLTNQIKLHFTGHLRDALLFAVEGGKRDGMGIWRDAKRLEAAMAGAGTADVLLIARFVRGHWDRNRLEQIKLAYQQKYKKPLLKRVQGETSGHYRDALLTLINNH